MRTHKRAATVRRCATGVHRISHLEQNALAAWHLVNASFHLLCHLGDVAIHGVEDDVNFAHLHRLGIGRTYRQDSACRAMLLARAPSVPFAKQWGSPSIRPLNQSFWASISPPCRPATATTSPPPRPGPDVKQHPRQVQQLVCELIFASPHTAARCLQPNSVRIGRAGRCGVNVPSAACIGY
jgi:hypothetical protein